MIILNGKKVDPQKIKRIQLGNKIIFNRNQLEALAESEIEFNLDLFSLLQKTSAVPLDNELGFLFELASSPETELHIITSDISEVDFDTDFEIDPELYVELTAPMKFDDPVIFVLETEAIVPKAAICETEEQIPIIFEAEANAPKTAKTDTSEKFEIDLDFAAEANAADSTPLKGEVAVFRLDAKAELKAASAANAYAESALILGIGSEAKAAETVFTEANFGTKFEMEAELWIKPGEWTNPVLKNSVLGITQALSTIQNGNILRIG